MTLAAALVHLDAAGLAPGAAVRGDRLMLDLALLTLLIVAGRVMPFFTERAVAGSSPVIRPWVERLTFTLATVLVLADLAWPNDAPGGVLAIALAAVQLARLAGWHDHRAWKEPMLAVLYAGYAWLIAGLLLDGLGRSGSGAAPGRTARPDRRARSES